MTLFQDTGGDPRAARALAADVLAWFGAVGDAALGNAPGFAARKASLAVAVARNADFSQSDCDALYFAGLLHAVGAIGNAAYRKGSTLSERIARQERWDAPAQGARFCAAIGTLPPETEDMVRWQHEAWDGTGYPDSLRWTGIPKAAQILGLADRFVGAPDPEEALGQIGLASGRAFNPAAVRAFTMWFHMTGGEIEMLAPPAEALGDPPPLAAELVERCADVIDAHNGVPGRWRRVAAIAAQTAGALKLSDDEASALALACRIFGAGEIAAESAEDENFDPLGRLGIEDRARNAEAGAAFAQPYDSLRSAAAIIAARGEWFDGTGKPRGLSRKNISLGSAVLSAAIALERLDRPSRLDEAAGTQFDPAVVRVLLEIERVRK
jgi:response regulator RpfG family c-di-GMP phosphodiesterase